MGKIYSHTKKQIITPNFFPRAKVSNFFGARVLVPSHTKKPIITPKFFWSWFGELTWFFGV
jgi:hypothetical protein